MRHVRQRADPRLARLLVPLADESRPVVLLAEPVQQRRRMRRSHHLRLRRRGLTAQQLQQESRPTRVDPVLDLFYRDEIGHVGLEERGSERCETQGPVAEDRRGELPAVLSKHEQRLAHGAMPYPDVVDLLGAELAEPGQIGVLRCGGLIDGLNEGCEILSPITHALHFSNLRVGPQHRQFGLHPLDVRQQPGHAAGVVLTLATHRVGPLQSHEVVRATDATTPRTAGDLSKCGTCTNQIHRPSLRPRHRTRYGKLRVLL